MISSSPQILVHTESSDCFKMNLLPILCLIGEKLHAHSLILKACAPRLAELCGNADCMTSVSAIDMLTRRSFAIYFSVSVAETFQIHHKCGRYRLVGYSKLKDKADGWNFKIMLITLNNSGEIFHFSYTKTCALLKEKYYYILTDFLAASARKKCNTNDDIGFEIMSINMLRRELDEKGSDVDGKREMLITEY
ncbi:LOW QUALITY PROTEIN: hypothetical protein ACHAWF_005247 [Thalassiosira exigua]